MAKTAFHLLNDEMCTVRLAFLTSALIRDVSRRDSQINGPQQRQRRETLGEAFHHQRGFDLQASGFRRVRLSACFFCIHREPPAKNQFIVPPLGGSFRYRGIGQFVVPPLGGSFWYRGMGLQLKLPPKGGTTNCHG